MNFVTVGYPVLFGFAVPCPSCLGGLYFGQANGGIDPDTVHVCIACEKRSTTEEIRLFGDHAVPAIKWICPKCDSSEYELFAHLSIKTPSHKAFFLFQQLTDTKLQCSGCHSRFILKVFEKEDRSLPDFRLASPGSIYFGNN